MKKAIPYILYMLCILFHRIRNWCRVGGIKMSKLNFENINQEDMKIQSRIGGIICK